MPSPTPFFPAWQNRLAPMGSRVAAAVTSVRAATLCQLEQRLDSGLPPDLFPKAPAQQNSRDRIYTQQRTFWSFLYQCLHPHTSCREIVRQVQALFALGDGPAVSPADGAYCRARRRLPHQPLVRALSASAHAAARPLVRPPAWLQGRPVKVIDGTTLGLPDTPENQQAYPQLKTLNAGCGFPLMRLMVFFCLCSGTILAALPGSYYTAELRLCYQMLSGLQAQDILLGDRQFDTFWLLACLRQMQADFIGRAKGRIDGRRAKRRLGRNDWLFGRNKPVRPSVILTAAQWAELPEELMVRVVRGCLYRKGYRVRQMTVVTTLLDPERYPAKQILQAYLRRWRLELCLDDLKTTLGMDQLRCQSPAMVEKELYMHLIAHNLIRHTMAQAATEHEVALERLSFKGTLDSLRQFTLAASQARSKKKQRKLAQELLRTIAADLVPERLGRREPRAVKRQFHKYPYLCQPRHRFRDRMKRNVRTALARLRHPITVAK